MLSYITLSVEYSSLEFEIMLLKQSSPYWCVCLGGKKKSCPLLEVKDFFTVCSRKLRLDYARYSTEMAVVNWEDLFCLAVRL